MFTNGRVLWKSLIILGYSKILILYNLDSRIDCLQRLIIISCYCDRQYDFFARTAYRSVCCFAIHTEAIDTWRIRYLPNS